MKKSAIKGNVTVSKINAVANVQPVNDYEVPVLDLMTAYDDFSMNWSDDLDALLGGTIKSHSARY